MGKIHTWLYRNYDIMLNLIETGSRILDLGCGTGEFLKLLKSKKNVFCQGIEIDEKKVIECIKNGVPVIQGDIDEGLKNFKTNSFDYVILNQTLQMVKKPDFVLEEMLRVGKKAIVGFPNFGYYKIRLNLLLKGTMPVCDFLPFKWYNSPNIHLFTIKDFISYCRYRNYKIIDSFFIMNNKANFLISKFPNILATESVFLLER